MSDSILPLRIIVEVKDPVTGEPAQGWVLEADLKVPTGLSEVGRAQVLYDYEQKLREEIVDIHFETRRENREPVHLKLVEPEESDD